jgi:hypothetical protein
MIFRLAFVKTQDAYLKVTASARGAPVLVAIHLNPHTFAIAARLAGVKEQDTHELGNAASKAWEETGMDVCCEAIELDSDQLTTMGFAEDWRRFAS